MNSLTIRRILFSLFISFAPIALVGKFHQVKADCGGNLVFQTNIQDQYITGGDNSYTVTVIDPTKAILQNGNEYILEIFIDSKFVSTYNYNGISSYAQNGSVTFNVTEKDYPTAFQAYTFRSLYRPQVEFNYNKGSGVKGCLVKSYFVFPAKVTDLQVYQKRDIDGDGTEETCYGGASGGCMVSNVPFTVQSTIVNGLDQPLGGKMVKHLVDASVTSGGTSDANGTTKSTIKRQNATSYTIKVVVDAIPIQQSTIQLSKICGADNPYQCVLEPANLAITSSTEAQPDPYKMCSQIDQKKFPEMYQNCLKCTVGEDGEENEGVWTAIGCIRKDPVEIVQNLIKIGLGMGGGVALLMILISGFIISTSQGDPKRLGDAKEMVVAAVTGLLFVIFSVVILEFIGYSVFRIPGFGG